MKGKLFLVNFLLIFTQLSFSQGQFSQTTTSDFKANNNFNVNTINDEIKLKNDVGNGNDGDLYIPPGGIAKTDNIKTGVIEDNPSGQNAIQVTSSGGFNISDEVIIITIQDSNTDLNNNIAGQYEFKKIKFKTATALILDENLKNNYNSLGKKHQVIRIPNYNNVTIDYGGTLTCDDWDGNTGGVLIFRAKGLVQVLALAIIDASYKGFRGGQSAVGGWTNGYQGEGFFGTGSQGVYFNNSNAGGSGMMEVTYSSAGGGGGGHGSVGANGETTYNTWGYPIEGGYGGEIAGNQFLAKIFMGGAGGSGGTYGGVSGKGGDGGGIIYVSCDSLYVVGNILTNGENGKNGQNNGGGGGGGAGGSIYIITTKNLDLGNSFIKALSGARGVGSAQGGLGGCGRIRVDAPSIIGSSDPPVGYNGVSYALLGTSITPNINKPIDQYWGVLNFTANTNAPGTSIHIDVISSTDSVLKADVSSGTLLNDAGIGKNINSIKLKARLLNSYGNQTPILYDWGVEWTPTPVELISFNSQFNQTTMNINLEWQTATETNNYGFDVERAILGDWQKIGFVKGNGTTTVPQKYGFTDNLNDINEQISNSSNTVKYRLKQIDFGGAFEYSTEIEVAITQKPLTFNLNQNYPNPFNPSTKIKFEIPRLSQVKLTIYDILGREITTLVNEVFKPGRYEFSWDASNYPSGVYFYKIKAGSYLETRKMILIR